MTSIKKLTHKERKQLSKRKSKEWEKFQYSKERFQKQKQEVREFQMKPGYTSDLEMKIMKFPADEQARRLFPLLQSGDNQTKFYATKLTIRLLKKNVVPMVHFKHPLVENLKTKNKALAELSFQALQFFDLSEYDRMNIRDIYQPETARRKQR